MSQEIIDAVVPILKAIGAGLFGALFVGYIAHLLTKDRESIAGRKGRKREFLAFMQGWKMEIERLHLEIGGFARRQSAFFDGAPDFARQVELIRSDFGGRKRKNFNELAAAISSRSGGYYAYKHDELIKAIDELIAFVADSAN